MIKENTVLIVDDEKVNRLSLRKILSDTYEIVEAENGRQAIEILEREQGKISAIVLDLIMPEFSGYSFMEEYAKSKIFGMIPVVIATVAGDSKTEQECLKMGAWDFVGKPYDASIIQFRVKNVIDRSQNQVSKELRYRTQFSEIAPIYNMSMFNYATRQMFERNPDQKFALIRMDIDKFRLVNAFFGRTEGNRLLKYMADYLLQYENSKELITFGHMSADVFCVCLAYEKVDEILAFIKRTNQHMEMYELEFDIELVYGIYLIENTSYHVSEMYEFANQASKSCKEEFNIQKYAFYEAKMRDDIIKEQRIVNNMRGALAGEEFVLYIQPKYELRTNELAGGEVLVRWIDPKRGMISPGDFIPVFERNGFILKLDYYIWEKSCQLIRKWLDEGKTPMPISVNLSRVSLYNPRVTEVLCDLVDKYHIPPALLQLELTESAYTTNQHAIKSVMEQLQERGFTIMMDDFGSGYSSLNVLKDLKVDVLKIDMKFLGDTENEIRSQNILAAVVRMAKWLKLPVIAEGVERKEQVLFLNSIGCEYVQGYYFAKPMPAEEYEKLAFESIGKVERTKEATVSETVDKLSSTPQLELLFSNMQQAVAIYEYTDGRLEVVRVNDAYYKLFGYDDINGVQSSLNYTLNAGNKNVLFEAFDKAVESKDSGACEMLRQVKDGEIWISVKLKYISQIGNRHLIYGYINDITEQKEIDAELQKYRKVAGIGAKAEETMLIVDDTEVNRASLSCIFEERYRILEAENGKQALEILEKEAGQVDMILLDLVMPEMDGTTFLRIKKDMPEIKEIPVVIITADDTTEQQIDTMRMGADEYIVKPFIPEIVIRRVENVLDSSRSFRRITHKSNHES